MTTARTRWEKIQPFEQSLAHLPSPSTFLCWIIHNDREEKGGVRWLPLFPTVISCHKRPYHRHRYNQARNRVSMLEKRERSMFHRQRHASAPRNVHNTHHGHEATWSCSESIKLQLPYLNFYLIYSAINSSDSLLNVWILDDRTLVGCSADRKQCSCLMLSFHAFVVSSWRRS